jgi:hypothetical protein
MDADGSNTRRIYPEVGENSAFPREAQFMQLGPLRPRYRLHFRRSLYLLDVDSGSAYRVTQDDAVASRPTWAPYGAAINTAGAGSRLTPVEPGRNRLRRRNYRGIEQP